MLQEIRSDAEKTVLPDWVKNAPKAMGSASHGKLSADEWRTVCTINMVITLVRIWGASSATTRERDMLENFLHLVIATTIATRRHTSARLIVSFKRHMTAYLTSLTSLFPDAVLSPNHHLSLHLPEFFEQLGPAHSWWTFPFERFNGILQKIPTNFQFGTYSIEVSDSGTD